MSPGFRKFALSVHLTFSIGWIGGVVAYLSLGIAAATSRDAQIVRAGWIAMELTGWFAIVPLAIASLVTGLIMALGTKWGLFRHYWVMAKLLINLFATVVLLAYMQTLRELSAITAETSLADLDAVRSPSPLLHAGAALTLLLVAMILAVYKPRGMTAYGQRKQREQRAVPR
jgi:uncharacterized membrane protein